MNQENQYPFVNLNDYEKQIETSSSSTISKQFSLSSLDTDNEISPLSDRNSRFEYTKIETRSKSNIPFQPALRPRIPFNLSSTNTIDKQAHAYTIWLNSLFTPVEFVSNSTKSLKFLVVSNRWHMLRDRARDIFIHDIQPIATKITFDIDIENCRINPKPDMNFLTRTIHRQALLTFISSFNRIWFRLGMEILFRINIENDHQMKSSIDQYLLQSTNDINLLKKINSNNTKIASTQIRFTIKNLIILIIFLERAKILRLIDNDPCLYNRDSKFKSTKESLDRLTIDFISSDTNLLRRLKLAGYEPTYKQTSFDEYNYFINPNEQKLFDELKDGIRLTRCAQILLSKTNKNIAQFDLSTKLKCPVVNLVHKLLNLDQAFDFFETYGHVNLVGISNKDIMNGNKQRTLEFLWRIYTNCYLSKHLFPIEKLKNEIFHLNEHLLNSISPIEQELIKIDIVPLQNQQTQQSEIVDLLIKWIQLICAHYKFWLYDLQESFADGRAFLYLFSYYLPEFCDYKNDIKHLTTLATCQTDIEHVQFNIELSQQQKLKTTYERNVKSNFCLLEELVKQNGISLSCELIKYENYAKDIPDERCTMIILSLFAYDLLYSNAKQKLEIKSMSDTIDFGENDNDDSLDHYRTTMASITLEDFVQLEKTIENEGKF